MVDRSGENNGAHKLKIEDVIRVYEMSWSGKYSIRELGRRYGVHHSTIVAVKHRKNWRWLWGETQVAMQVDERSTTKEGRR